jgi:hypothetical protein
MKPMKIRLMLIAPMALAISASFSSPAFANSAVSSWLNFKGSQADCLRDAKNAMSKSGRVDIQNQEVAVYGYLEGGRYQSVIHCVAEKGIVFFYTHGPLPSLSEANNRVIIDHFQEIRP